MRLSFKWLGQHRQVEGEAKVDLNEFLETTDSRMVSHKKRLFDPKTEEVKKLNSLKTETVSYWKNNSLPYMEKGVRLVRREKYPAVKLIMDHYLHDIVEAEQSLESNRGVVLEAAENSLGPKLWNRADYPDSFIGHHGFELECVNVEPPSYLMELDKKAYDEAMERVNQKFESSIEVWEDQMYTGLSKALNHLVEKMKPGEDGKKKVFHASTFDGLLEFFKQYKELKVRDNPQLDQLVSTVQEKLGKFDVAGIRSSEAVKGQVLEAFEGLASEAAKFVVTLPKRKVGK